MIRTQIVLLVALLFCGVYCQQIANFEGTYTSAEYGQFNYLCQNGNLVQGSYDEAGIFRCTVDDSGVCSGVWFEAGTGLCNTGGFSISLTAAGFEGTYTCNGLEGSFPYTETKLDGFRPTDSQCALLALTDTGDDDDDDDYTLEGRWSDVDNFPTDICFLDDDSDRDISQVVASYDYLLDGVPTEGYFVGYHSFDGKVAWGTWYEDLDAGAMIFFVRNNRNVDSFWWTGLVGRRGYTFIDGNQFNSPDYHDTYTLTDRAVTSQSICERYSILYRYVLKNVRFTDTNQDGYYFVDPYFKPAVNLAEEYGYFAPPSSASTITVSVLSIAFTLLFVFF